MPTLTIAELTTLGDAFNAAGDADPVPATKLTNYAIASRYLSTAAMVFWLSNVREEVRWQGRTGHGDIEP